jgi:hypothetical protein
MKKLLAAALLALLWGSPVSAETVIDFSGPTGGAGTILYGGGASNLVGENIAIGGVHGINTPQNADTVFEVSGGLLDFSTGAFQSYDPATDTYFFGGDGTISIMGTVSEAGILEPTLLLSGTVTGARYLAGVFELTVIVGSDQKSAQLLDFFGLPADTLFRFSGSVHTTDPSPYGEGGFRADAFSADIANTVIPEPASLAIFGLGIASVALQRRRG